MQVPLNDLRRVHAPHAAAFRDAYDRVFSRGAYVLGAAVQSFEAAFAEYCGTRHCIGVANGSDALEIALRAVGVQAGDRVASVANAAMYSTLAIRAIGAMPLYVEVDERTLTMSPSALAATAGSRPRAVVVTHLYGQLADMVPIAATVAQMRVPLVEDCAQAHGATRDGKRAGAYGTAACFSFYPTKNLGALGDGGAITTDHSDIAESARALRQYGWSSKYCVSRDGGRNSRLDELQSAFLHARLAALDIENASRRAIHNAYASDIRHPQIRAPLRAGADHVAHLAVIRTAERNVLRRHLAACGISTDVHYPIADHLQPIAADPRPTLPITERACDEVLSLPCFPGLTDGEIAAVVEACNTWVS